MSSSSSSNSLPSSASSDASPSVVPMDTSVARVQIVPHELKVSGKDITFNAEETLFGGSLLPCVEIINQYKKIWFAKKPGKTAARIRQASTLLNGLTSTVISMKNPQQMAVHMHAAMRGKKWSEIILCIYTFRNATDDEKKIVRAHRYELQNHLLTFIESLQNYYATITVDLKSVSWPTFLAEAVQQVNDAVADIENEPAEAEQNADDNPLVQ